MNDATKRNLVVSTLIAFSFVVFLCLVIFYLAQGSSDEGFVSGGVSRSSTVKSSSNLPILNPATTKTATTTRSSSARSTTSKPATSSASTLSAQSLLLCGGTAKCTGGTECRSGICVKPTQVQLVAQKKVEISDISCGGGGSFCPKSTQTCIGRKCIDTKTTQSNIALHPVGKQADQAKPIAFSGQVTRGGEQAINCKYYSPTSQACTNPLTNEVKIYDGLCCLGYDHQSSEAASACEVGGVLPDGSAAGPNYCRSISSIVAYNQNNPLVSNTPIPDGKESGKINCTFVNAGCGPSSVYYILRERGITDYQYPTDLLSLPAYDDFSCDGSSVISNGNALATNGINVEYADGEIVDEIPAALAAGNQVFVLVQVSLPSGRTLLHYAVLVGNGSDGSPLVYDPIFDVNGNEKDPNSTEPFSLNQIRNNGVGYEIIGGFFVGQ